MKSDFVFIVDVHISDDSYIRFQTRDIGDIKKALDWDGVKGDLEFLRVERVKTIEVAEKMLEEPLR